MKPVKEKNRMLFQTVIFQIIISAFILLCIILFLSGNIFLSAAKKEQGSTGSVYYNTNMHNVSEYDDTSDSLSDNIQNILISNSDGAAETNVSPDRFTGIINNSFEKTLFIGDSLTVGLQLYGGISDADYFCITGIGVNGIRRSDMNGIMLDSKLETMQYERIYIMLGINDMGINRENYLSSYRSLVNYIREKQPDAYIIIQSILVVTDSYTNMNPIFDNTEVKARNEALSELADYDHIFYLELNNYFMNADGNLFNNMSTDGCHLAAESYSIWSNVLINHNISD